MLFKRGERLVSQAEAHLSNHLKAISLEPGAWQC